MKFFTSIREKFFKSQRVDSEFKTVNSQQIFNKIYRQRLWGKNAAGAGTSGRGSHDPHIITPYVFAVKKVLAGFATPPIMVDLGCGDFNVGQHFTPDVSTLIACDVSDIVLAQNAEIHSAENTRFMQLDLAKGPLPKGDICCVRQVLQHLANSEISAFVAALHTQKPYRALIITEHISGLQSYVPNKDKYSGLATRVSLDSGIDLTLPPFALKYLHSEILLEIQEPCEGRAAILRTTLYTFDKAFPTIPKKGE